VYTYHALRIIVIWGSSTPIYIFVERQEEGGWCVGMACCSRLRHMGGRAGGGVSTLGGGLGGAHNISLAAAVRRLGLAACRQISGCMRAGPINGISVDGVRCGQQQSGW